MTASKLAGKYIAKNSILLLPLRAETSQLTTLWPRLRMQLINAFL